MIIEIEHNTFPILDIERIEEIPALGILRVWMKSGNMLDFSVESKAKREAYKEEYGAKYEATIMKQAVVVGEIYSQRMIESFEQSLVPPPSILH